MSPAKIPHYPISYKPVHITYRLAGSISKKEVNATARRRQKAIDELNNKLLGIPAEHQHGIRTAELRLINSRYELALDSILHNNRSGPFFLQQSEVQKIILDSWLNLQERAIVFVIAVCVMGNHVHAIVKAPSADSIVDVSSLMESHKKFTARMSNRILGRTGQTFWDSTFFDKRIRTGKFMTAMWYVLNNPVKAGLVKNWEDWNGTYVNPEYIDLFTVQR